jgi:hypothetical protein
MVLLAKYNLNDHVKNGEMGRAFNMNGGEEEGIYFTGGQARRWIL